LFELGTVYRNEKAGVLHGLLRVKGFTQDDAHIFCLPEQLKGEIDSIIDFVIEVMRIFGFEDLEMELSTRPSKYIGSDKDWKQATQILEEVLKEKAFNYKINPGEGAFYGPKIDIKLKDALKRKWQAATIQCDFNLPSRFKLSYIDEKGKKKQPVMLHRVILGSLERFLGVLLEHYAGNLPLWLAPLQVIIIPVKEDFFPYASEIKEILERESIRCQIDNRSQTLNKRIRDAEIEKIPYILVIGEKEKKNSTLTVRRRHQTSLEEKPIKEFLLKLKEEIEKKFIF
ncbi:MAG: His/Gly/Thr/Pro-type tRNA ligase C-terminal domain-containing protein, partial [Candidatus Omnitrophica bacterium]|nr:His/Gly/Thr/Pro-type tRNA ligase C-terminal domain-containing protein [Candidatus Omnitrophota bacterium]